MFRARVRLIFSFIINQYFTPYVCYTTKNVFKTSNRMLFSLLWYFFNTNKFVSKASGNLLFGWLSYFSNMKKICIQIKWKPATFLIQKMSVQNKHGSFLVYSTTFAVWKHVCSKKSGRQLFSLSIIKKYYTPKNAFATNSIKFYKIFIKYL